MMLKLVILQQKLTIVEPRVMEPRSMKIEVECRNFFASAETHLHQKTLERSQFLRMKILIHFFQIHLSPEFDSLAQVFFLQKNEIFFSNIKEY